MRAARPLALLGTAYALAGCGASASQDIQAKLQQFAHAVAGHQTSVLCHQVLDPVLVTRITSAGLSCESAMQTFVQSVSNPTLAVSKVRVTGKTATAVVLASAQGQKAVVETVHLTDTKNGWRLTSLTAPR